MSNHENPNSVQVNDTCVKGKTGTVEYGVAKIVGADALVIKVGLTRQRGPRTITRIPLAELYPLN